MSPLSFTLIIRNNSSKTATGESKFHDKTTTNRPFFNRNSVGLHEALGWHCFFGSMHRLRADSAPLLRKIILCNPHFIGNQPRRDWVVTFFSPCKDRNTQFRFLFTGRTLRSPPIRLEMIELSGWQTVCGNQTGINVVVLPELAIPHLSLVNKNIKLILGVIILAQSLLKCFGNDSTQLSVADRKIHYRMENARSLMALLILLMVTAFMSALMLVATRVI